jgi:hypothetical protein
MAIRYTPRAQYNPPYDECDAEDCDSLTVTCTGGMYVEIIRDGRTREAWVRVAVPHYNTSKEER